MTSPTPIRLHRFRLSGHSHRVELLLSLLHLPFEIVDVPSGGHKTPEFLAWNRFGQVPVVEVDGLVLADSNAILVYLASVHDPDRTWYPADPATAAGIQRWLSVAAGPLLQGPALARLVGLFDAQHDLARSQSIAAMLFAAMEGHLAASGGYFVGARPTIADLALYTYTAHAEEGHIPLGPWSEIRAWLARIEALPGFVPMACSTPRFGKPAEA
jgi:glutathione S-transferase